MKFLFDKRTAILASLLRSKRVNAGLTQKSLAKKLKCQQALISKIEQGQRRVGVIDVQNFCKVVGIPLPAFITEYENASKKA